MPEQTTEVTLGEVNRNVTSLMSKMDTLSERVSAGPDWSDVRRIETALVERISSLEDNNRWLVRAVLGIIIAAIIGTVLVTR